MLDQLLVKIRQRNARSRPIAIASHKMRIADQPLHGGHIGEVPVQRDVAREWIRQAAWLEVTPWLASAEVNELGQGRSSPALVPPTGTPLANQRVQSAFHGPCPSRN